MEFALDPGLLVVLAAALTLGLARRAKPPRLRLELGSFPSRWRAVVATALLVLVVAVIVLRPIAAMVDPAEVVDLEGASFARLFAAHAVLAAFLLAWWALAGFPPPAGFLSVPGPDLWRRLVIGVGAGVAVWVLTIGTMSLIGGEIDFIIAALPNVPPHLKTGKLRALAITSKARHPLVADIPTTSEVGLPGLTITSWTGLMTASATPPEIIKRINLEVTSMLKQPEMVQKLNEQGFEVVANSPDEAQAFMAAEVVRWGKIVREANIKAE